MAKAKPDKALYKRLRANGVRKRVAASVSEALPKSGKAESKPAQRAIAELTSAVEEMKDRVKGGPAKRSAAAKKAAKTRRAKARKRSTAAKKGARTRARR